ncbi:MAG: hydroxymethylbilane synthase [Clostridium sp.]|nr:hydroxymethylbilane synthase [Clostridium sp.]
MKKSIVIGTRGSKLALLQTNIIMDYVKNLYPHLKIEVKTIKTTGDKILNKSLSKIGGKGLFIKEIEDNLRECKIDLAIHSMKDVQNEVSEEFKISTILKREDPRDAIISRNNIKFSKLKSGAIVGTSSLRRMVQLRSMRSDLEYKPVRGNVDTRIKKLNSGEFDAVVLASAGLKRMGLEENITEYLDTNKCIPSVGQGALCIEMRNDDSELYKMLKPLIDDNDYRCVFSERAFLREMNGGCTTAIGAYAEENWNKITINGFVCDDNNEKIFKGSVAGDSKDYEKIGVELGEKLKLLKAGE